MRVITCVVCGKKDIDRSMAQNKKYCSEACFQKARYSKGVDMDCKFNKGVGCLVQNCESCGWNPKVEKIRKARIEKEMREDG